MKTKQYTVWVGGSEIGTYATEDDAVEVYDEWRDDGYLDVEIDEWVNDDDTPEEMNNHLLSIGF